MSMISKILSYLRHILTSPKKRKLRAGFITAIVSYYILGYLRRTRTTTLQPVAWTTFLDDVGNSQVARAVVDKTSVKYILKNGDNIKVAQRLNLPKEIMSKLKDSGAIVSSSPPSRSVLQIIVAMLPVIYIAAMVGFLYKFYKDSVGDVGSQAATKMKRNGTASSENEPSFDMVAGIDSAKHEVKEVVDLLKNPNKYKRMGARVPKGVLLVGPPGTGKTMLAKCVASEANVPFFYCSGSEFVEIFAGRGASRVRNLFKRARKKSPSIVFIDELDALGKKRSGGFTSNEERDQTLNELLTSMDGFNGDEESNGPVVVMAATNRYEVLDPALTRPGRFDRVIHVGLPDVNGRNAILRVHLANTPCETSLNVEEVGKKARNFSGAELAGLVNEAKIRAVREGSRGVGTRHLESALLSFQTSRNGGGSSKSSIHGSGHPSPSMQQSMQEFLDKLMVSNNGRSMDA
jgi:cell division protease FtsH